MVYEGGSNWLDFITYYRNPQYDILLNKLIMYQKFTELTFVIGLFFLIVAIILLVNTFTAGAAPTRLDLYTGFAFLLFGLIMMLIRTRKETGDTDNPFE